METRTLPRSGSAAERRPTARRRRNPPAPPGVSRAAWEQAGTRYARAVLTGKVVAGRLVQRACHRHLRDLVSAGARGFYFDPETADRAIEYFLDLRHTKGSQWAGQPIQLAPWQEFVVSCIFGWKKKANGRRRFRFAYVETGKGSGKSTLAAGVGVKVTFCDEPIEDGAEGYCAATKREQAKQVWLEARAMILSSPGFASFLRVWGGAGPKSAGSIGCEERRQFLMPLSKDSKGLQGVNPHCAIVDELHEHKDRDVLDILRQSSVKRPQPLVFAITNSGFGETTICWEVHDRGRQVLDGGPHGRGLVEDDSFFAFIACIDRGDDWREEKNWPKANPSLGVTTSLEDIRVECEQAKRHPGSEASFRRFFCGEWLAVEERAIDMQRWNDGNAPFDPAILKGRPCFAGLDLSTTIDLTAYVLLFPPTSADPRWFVLPRIYLPGMNIEEASRRDRVDYVLWRSRGLVFSTPSGAVDYSFVEAQVEQDAKEFDLRAIGYDPQYGEQTRQSLEAKGFLMIKLRQGTMTLGRATRKLEELYMGGLLAHGGHEVLRWCASNVVWRRDANNGYMPDKGHAGRFRLRIDAVSALVNALAAAEFAPPPPPRPYRTRGIRFIG